MDINTILTLPPVIQVKDHVNSGGWITPPPTELIPKPIDTPIGKPIPIVYKFIAPYTVVRCKKMGGTGINPCIETENINFKVGDTVVSYDDTPQDWGRTKGLYIQTENGWLPISVLSIITDVGSTPLSLSANNTSTTGLQSFLTPKNIIIGLLLVVSGYFVYKKLKT